MGIPSSSTKLSNESMAAPHPFSLPNRVIRVIQFSQPYYTSNTVRCQGYFIKRPRPLWSGRGAGSFISYAESGKFSVVDFSVKSHIGVQGSIRAFLFQNNPFRTYKRISYRVLCKRFFYGNKFDYGLHEKNLKRTPKFIERLALPILSHLYYMTIDLLSIQNFKFFPILLSL